MDQRLETIASLVEEGSRLIDIGTDHGYLPLALLDRGIVEDISVSDIGEGPLQSARETLAGKEVRFYLSDGLPQEGSFDAAIIAGMGGHTIAGILEKDLPRFQSMRYLLLQPMQHIVFLRAFLQENGFRIVAERMAWQEHYYMILKLVPGEEGMYDFDLGKDLSRDRTLYLAYLSKEEQRLAEILKSVSGERREQLIDLLERIEKRRASMV